MNRASSPPVLSSLPSVELASLSLLEPTAGKPLGFLSTKNALLSEVVPAGLIGEGYCRRDIRCG